MNQREKRLAMFIGIVAGIVILVKVVYPATIKPWFDMDDKIARLVDDLIEQEEKRDRIDDALLTYKRLVERTGDVDPMKVRNSLQRDLEDLIKRQQLQSPETRVTPKRPTTDRKTGLHTVSLSIVAEGRLERIIRFMGKCYELPYITRFKDIKLAPATGKIKNKDKKADRVRISATLNVLVLPEHARARDLIDLDALRQPAKRVKHAGEPLAMIWERKPFNEYVKVKPRPVKKPEKRGDVSKPSEPDETPKTPETPKPTVVAGDPNRKDKYVAGIMRYGQDELLIIDKRRKTNEYVAKGEKLDGGDLLYVHPYGGVVRKEDGDYFYELGLTLDQAVLLKDGMDLDEVNRLAMRLPPANPDLSVDELPAEESSQASGTTKSPGTSPASKTATRLSRPSSAGKRGMVDRARRADLLKSSAAGNKGPQVHPGEEMGPVEQNRIRPSYRGKKEKHGPRQTREK